MTRFRSTGIALALLGALTVPSWTAGQAPGAAESQPPQGALPAPVTQKASEAGSPVMLGDRALFSVSRILSYSSQTRAALIGKRIEGLENEHLFDPDSLVVTDSEFGTDIAAGDLVVMSITDHDAANAGVERHALALDYAKRIATAIKETREERSAGRRLENIAYALGCTAVLIGLLWLMARIFPRLYRKIESWKGTILPSLHIQQFELLAAERVAHLAVDLARLVRLALTLNLLYFYASLVLGFFPLTRGYARALLGYVGAPLKMIGTSLLTYLPDMFFVAVILGVALLVTKAIHIVFDEIGKGTIRIAKFYPEWAEPTFNILRIMIFALTAVVVFPYLPGSNSPAFRGISIFVGVLFSLGSTSAVANIVSGVILTYMRAFHPGERVRIADTIGDVIEKNLLITRLRTIKNEEVTIANAMVLGSQIVNYSSMAQTEGLILHASVTIGYNAPWRTVHALLIDAALSTQHILHEPRPFVWQNALNDFYVQYEINAFTANANKMFAIYAELHANIQDKFNEGGVEIMSPHYTSVRDGNQVTIPEQHLPEDYVAPVFRVGLSGNGGGNNAAQARIRPARSTTKP
jgi:small-conductance mechanosensitive channel